VEKGKKMVNRQKYCCYGNHDCDRLCREYENGRVICPVHGRLLEGEWKDAPRKMRVIGYYVEMVNGLPKLQVEYEEH